MILDVLSYIGDLVDAMLSSVFVHGLDKPYLFPYLLADHGPDQDNVRQPGTPGSQRSQRSERVIVRSPGITTGLQFADDTLVLSPTTQIVVVGFTDRLRKQSFGDELSWRLPGVTPYEFHRAVNQSKENETTVTPLFLNLAYLISLPVNQSRHNSPTRSYELFKALKSIKIPSSVNKLGIILCVPYEALLAHVCAIARAYPAFTHITSNAPPDQVHILILGNRKEGRQPVARDLTALKMVGDNIRTCAFLVDSPAAEMNTLDFVGAAIKMISVLSATITKEIIVGDSLKKQGFGGIYHVGKAGSQPPILARFSHTPPHATKSYALVGKGIVFDCGGMQIKSGTAMPSMKSDMAGAAALLAAFCSLVEAGFGENLHVVLCVAENAISPTATKPDDVIRLFSGKSVEVTHTDAEGRLVLGDGVAYAKKVLKADVIIDMATLTGAQSYATGRVHAGVQTNNPEWERLAVAAGKASGDLVHPLIYAPDLHFGDLSSPLADMKNHNLEGGRANGSAIAGLFIHSHINFDPKIAWMHFDIAHPAMVDGRATAFGVPLIIRLLGCHTTVPIFR